MNKTILIASIAGIAAAAASAVAADETTGPASTQAWAQWQGRVSFGTEAAAVHSALDTPDRTALRPVSLSLMGDYYLAGHFIGPGGLGGLRATGGVILGPRSTLLQGWPVASSGSSFSIGSRPFGATAVPYSSDTLGSKATLPYLGVGYTGLSVRSGWSVNADLGLVAQSPGNVVRLGRGQSLDDVVRDLRLAPVLQFGVAYAF